MDGQAVRKYAELLRAGRWFHALPGDLQERLMAAGAVKTVAADQRLFLRGDAPNGLFAVLDGSVSIGAIGTTGEQALITLMEPPTWFGEIGVLDEQPRSHDAIANAESLVVHVPQSAIRTMLEAEPRYWQYFGQLATTKLRLALLALEINALMPLSARLAHRLVMMAEGYGEWRDRQSRVIDARQAQLATMLSTSRQTVNQLLKSFEAQGLIRLSYGRIEVLDLEGLKSAASAEALKTGT